MVIRSMAINGETWTATHESDENGDRVWIEREGECLGTYEGVEMPLPREICRAIDCFYEQQSE